VLVAAIGNSDRGDDAVGPAIARRLRGRVPSGISVLELGGDALALIEQFRNAWIPPAVAQAPIVTKCRERRRTRSMRLASAGVVIEPSTSERS